MKKKTERLQLRLTQEIRKLLEQQCQEHGMNFTEYICALIKKDFIQQSHEQQIEDAMAENHVLNSLLLNPDISSKAKQLIGKEIGKYV